MITHDYKNGAYKYDTRKSKSGATYNHTEKMIEEIYFVDLLAGIAGAFLLLAPPLVFIYL